MPTEHSRGEQLDPDELLTAEFAYIAQSAFQANEDRARVTNFYLVTLASFVAALFGSQVSSGMVPEIYWAFAALFVVLVAESVLTLLQLVRLREAWFESVRAMNEIKAYYQARLPGLRLETALRWRSDTEPKRYKPWSVGFLLALQVALLGGVSAGAAVIFLGLARAMWLWGWAGVTFAACSGGLMALYRALLRERPQPRMRAKGR
jgi:hypothetical protein